MNNRDNMEDRVAEMIVCLLIIAVIVLKITNVIKVSWLIIFSPLIGLFALGVLFAMLFLISALIHIWRNK